LVRKVSSSLRYCVKGEVKILESYNL